MNNLNLNPETACQSIIFQLKSALEEIASGVKISKKRGATVQINLSAFDMQKIASDALTFIQNERPHPNPRNLPIQKRRGFSINNRPLVEYL